MVFSYEKNLEVLKNNLKGLKSSTYFIIAPKVYSITEDLGIIHGENNCKCGNFGKIFYN